MRFLHSFRVFAKWYAFSIREFRVQKSFSLQKKEPMMFLLWKSIWILEIRNKGNRGEPVAEGSLLLLDSSSQLIPYTGRPTTFPAHRAFHQP